MLAELLVEISRQGGYGGSGPEPVVSLEFFFDGNDDPASIGCNLDDHPGLGRFYDVLHMIASLPDVHRVTVGISEVMGPDEWPFSDHVYVVTSAPTDELMTWVAPLQSDPPKEGWWNDAPPRDRIDVPQGTRVVTLWWD